MKDLYREKADELADEEYEKEFYELPQNIQDEVHERAMNEVNDGLCDYADNLRKAKKEGL
ncbi:MAG: hypothetical protein Q7J27_14590 [Syntrophales bacterium]|nr:hypothetical protein [Syntrophales bacterium]